MSDTPRSPRRFLRPTRGEGPRAGIRQLWGLLAEHRGVLIAVAALSIAGAAMTLAQPALVGIIITRVQKSEPLGTLVAALVALVLVGSAISTLQHYLLQRTGTAVVLSSRRRLIRRILHLPISEFDARRTGDLVARVGTDTTLLYAVLTQGLADAVGGVLILLGALIAMALIDAVLLLLIVGVLSLSLLTVVLLARRIRVATRAQQERVGELTSAVERAIASIRTIRAAGATDREQNGVEAFAQAAYRAGVRIAQASAFVVPVAGIALQLALMVVLGVGGYRVASGAIGVASLVTFIMFLFLLIQPLGTFVGAIVSVGQALGALGRIQEILALPEETDAPATMTTTEAGDPGIAIEFRRVHFRYAASSDADAGAAEPAEVLQDVSFRVPRGARVALVGPSGAGKSTTLALIERFYDPTSGAILVDGHDIRSMERASLRARLGYVEQDAPTLAGSLADNLRLASPDADDAQCVEVLRAVNLGEVLDRSPLGLQAPVGEAGVMLSGGERQRLAIARAILAAPPILLLDESTSSLDGQNEQRMREAIDAVAEGRTLLLIAHRLSTVVDSDLIIVMDHGRVLAQGTHSELVASTPLYRDLAKHQLLV